MNVSVFLSGENTGVKLKVFPIQPIRKVVSTLSNIFFSFSFLFAFMWRFSEKEVVCG